MSRMLPRWHNFFYLELRPKLHFRSNFIFCSLKKRVLKVPFRCAPKPFSLMHPAFGMVFGAWATLFCLLICGSFGYQGCQVFVASNGTDSASCGSVSNPCKTIQWAVDIATSGQIVCVWSGDPYHSCSTLGTQVNKSLTLQSIGAGNAIIDCRGNGRAFDFFNLTATVVLRGFYITGGHGVGGGALASVLFRLDIQDCVFVNNSCPNGPNNGGAIFTEGEIVNINNCTFLDNGGTNYSVATAYVNYGGAISVSNVVMAITNSVFINNRATSAGGLHLAPVIALMIENCTFFNNSAPAKNSLGGAVLVVQMGLSLNLKINNNRFISNNAGVGAGVHVWRSLAMQNSAFLISNNEFFGNNATQAAGFSFSVEQQSLQSPLVEGNTIRFENNTFIDNLAQSQSSALYLWFYGTANTGNVLMVNNTVQIVGGAFINNTVLTGSSGAAVTIVGPANPPHLPTFPFGFSEPAERKWSYYSNWCVFDGVQFLENEGTCSTCSGGALLVQGGQTIIKNCVFDGNRAGLFGGAVVLNDMSSYLEVYNSSFSNNSAEHGGADLYSFAGAPISVVNSTFNSLLAADPFINIAQGGDVLFSRPSIRCDAGGKYMNGTLPTTASIINPWGLAYLRIVFLSCTACPQGTYSLTGDSVVEGVIDNNITCHSCLGETDCSRGGADVLTLPGYWCGAVTDDDPSTLSCFKCPDGYCSEDSTPWKDSCIGTREGILCGSCIANHSESFGTEDCVPDGDCNAAIWLLPVTAVAGLIFLVIVIWKPFNHHPLWKSTMYFMQIVPLVAGVDNIVMQIVAGLFSLNPSMLGISVSACPWPGFSPIQKISSDYVLPAILLVELLALCFLHHFLLGGGKLHRWCRAKCAESYEPLQQEGEVTSDEGDDPAYEEDYGIPPPSHTVQASSHLSDDDESEAPRRSQKQHNRTSAWDKFLFNDDDEDSRAAVTTKISLFSHYAGTLMGTLLLMYEGVTGATMELLNCIAIGNQYRLFRAGEVECSTWQIPLLCLLGAVLVPFPLILIGLRYLIRAMGWHETNGSGAHVLHVLEHPYQDKRLWYESFSILRRLVLLALATFVADPIWKAVALFIGCFLALLAHLLIQPFRKKHHGWVEAAFLCNLVLISALQLPEASYTSLGVVFSGQRGEIHKWLQVGLTLLPMCYGALVAGFHVIQGIYSKKDKVKDEWLRELTLLGMRSKGLFKS